MAIVELSDQEWNQVINILGDAPWKISNPLLMRIGGQLQRQQQQHTDRPANIQEVPMNIGENAVKQ